MIQCACEYFIPFVGQNYGFRPYFEEALSGRTGRYITKGVTSKKAGYYLARPVTVDGEIRGVVVAKMSFDALQARLEQFWRKDNELDLVTDDNGVVCGLGYAEGARLSRTLGGWQVISWALVLSLPIMLPIALLTMPAAFDHVAAPAWFGLAYVSVFSMLIGFMFWYRGLALGGIAAVSQLQLLQPFFGLGVCRAFC